ncbi:hypothetical protein Tco_1056351 [Tanacetum coccineum]|uniref:Uncharacterized protein n=1 Tax=Tanacetum coccineum TaxID=301880 RepID=A0ABQ5H355_9ASTR
MAQHGSTHRHLYQQVLDVFKNEGRLSKAIWVTSTTRNTPLEMGKYSHGFYHKPVKDNKLYYTIWIDDKLNFIEESVQIMDREVKQLKQSRIPIVKVLCWIVLEVLFDVACIDGCLSRMSTNSNSNLIKAFVKYLKDFCLSDIEKREKNYGKGYFGYSSNRERVDVMGEELKFEFQIKGRDKDRDEMVNGGEESEVIQIDEMDHLDAQERKQDKSSLENALDFEDEILDAEVQENEATPLSDEEIALDASSQGTIGSGSGGEKQDFDYDLTNYALTIKLFQSDVLWIEGDVVHKIEPLKSMNNHAQPCIRQKDTVRIDCSKIFIEMARWEGADVRKMCAMNKKNRAANEIPPIVGTKSVARKIDMRKRAEASDEKVEQITEMCTTLQKENEDIFGKVAPFSMTSHSG